MEIYENEKNNIFFNILQGVIIALIFTLVCLFVFSCLLVYTDISESLMQPVIIVATGVSILLGSSIGNRKVNKNGIWNGVLVGLVYILILYIISSIINSGNFVLGVQSLIMIAVGLVAGMIGGIIGVNIK